ncbi:MAG TPA: sugar ABC transporter permease [Gaiellaceae bacterium]|nr:sugar ABC transporter permease [Gaiellaceae bacterium]
MATPTTTTARLESVRSAKLKEALVGYGFVLVPMGFFLTFFIFPIVYAVYISFFDWGILGKIDSVGLANYRLMLEDEVFRRSLRNVAYYTAVVVPSQMALGLFLAVIVNNALRFRAFFRAAYYFPALASSAAITAIAIYILSADGLLNSILGTDQPWFNDSDTALESIMALNVWTTSGTMMLFYLAALQSIPTDVYEAAAIDGAGAWRTFRKITFPLLKPAHFFVAVLSVIGCLKVFDQAFIVSGGAGGPNYSTLTPVLYLYQVAIQDVNFGYAAALGVALFLLIFTATLVQRLLFGKPEVIG